MDQAPPAALQPAPADHPGRDAMVSIVFVAALFAALAGVLLHRDLAVTRFENRTTAPWPGWPDGRRPRTEWTKAFEAAFADRFGARDPLIAMHHALLAVGLHVSPVPKVLMARDGWLYFKGEDLQAIDRDFRGVVPYPPEQPAAIASELEHRRMLLAARGIPYVVLIVPDKATVYPEHLPAWVTRAPRTRLDALFAALKAYPELDVVDPRAALAAAKPQMQRYFRTDSHWNYAGGLVGYALLMQHVGRAVPGFTAAPAPQPAYEPGDVYSGDLAQLLGLPHWFQEPDVLPFGKVLADQSRRCARPIPDPVEPLVQGCDWPGLPRAVVYRDSMFDLLIPPVSENFSRVVYYAGHTMRMADIEREHPAIVIEEFVERAMHAVLADRSE